MLQCPSKLTALLGHSSFMATESTRLRSSSERLPPVTHVEVSHREIADAWLKTLNVNLETLYRKLPSMDDVARKSWQQEVVAHPFELAERDLLTAFDQVVDARRLSDEDLAVLKRTLLLDAAEHRLPAFAAQVDKEPRAYALQLLDEARSFSDSAVTMVSEQVGQSINDAVRMAAEREAKAAETVGKPAARNRQEWNMLASDARAALRPEITMLSMIDKEEKRRAGQQDPRAFGAEQVQWLRENPALLMMQTRDVDPDTATIATVIEKAGLPPKEATFVLHWLRQAGEPTTVEGVKEAIERLYPLEANLAVQKKAAFERTLLLLEGYPQSMLTPSDIGLPQELERQGRPSRMLIQMRQAMQDDLEIKPAIDANRRANDRQYQRDMSNLEHGLQVYDKQTLPNMLVRVLSDYNQFANASTADRQLESAWRMAVRLGERTSDIGSAAEAGQRIMRFLETAHRTWHGDGARVSAFLDTLRPEVIQMTEARTQDAALRDEIEQASLSLAKSRDENESRRIQTELESLRSRQQTTRRLLDSYLERFSVAA